MGSVYAYAAIALAAIAALGSFWYSAYRAGQNAEAIKRLAEANASAAEALANAQKRLDEQEALAKLSRADLDKLLARWLRD